MTCAIAMHRNNNNYAKSPFALEVSRGSPVANGTSRGPSFTGSSSRQRYRIVGQTSHVDETLFGSHNRTQQLNDIRKHKTPKIKPLLWNFPGKSSPEADDKANFTPRGRSKYRMTGPKDTFVDETLFRTVTPVKADHNVKSPIDLTVLTNQLRELQVQCSPINWVSFKSHCSSASSHRSSSERPRFTKKNYIESKAMERSVSPRYLKSPSRPSSRSGSRSPSRSGSRPGTPPPSTPLTNGFGPDVRKPWR